MKYRLLELAQLFFGRVQTFINTRFPNARPEDAIKEGSPLYRILVLTITAVVIGTIVSLLALGFVEIVSWLNHVFLISPRSRIQLDISGWLLAIITVIIPTIGGLLVGHIINRYCSGKSPHGPPEVILAVQLRQDLPDTRSGFASTFAAAISLGFGASVGQYGPLVYLGATIGNLVRTLNLKVKNLPAIAIACGVAAAISTAFNAPIAGMVFAHELILRHYSMQAFAPTTVASATGFVIANVIFERPPLFLVEFSGVNHSYEFLLFAMIGGAAAMVAVGFMRLVLTSAKVASESGIPQQFRPAFAGFVLGITALFLPDVLGVGNETLRFATIAGAFPAWELSLLVFAKIALTALCIGFGFSGGVFSPALLIGILFGSLSWSVLDGLIGIPTSGIAVYAICGMMAITSPVIGAPLTCILIVFELTRNYDLTIAAMVSVVFANLIVYRTFGRSLFDVQLARRGHDLSSGREKALLSSHLLEHFGSKSYPSATQEEALKEAIARMDNSPWNEVYVSTTSGVFLGTYRPKGEPKVMGQAVGNLVTQNELAFDETTTVWDAMEALRGFVGDAVPLVDSKNGKLRAVITESAVISAYLGIVHDLHQEENAPV